MTSPFDPKTFASMTFTETNSTESYPVPVGEWPGEITKCEVSSWSKRDDPTKAGLKYALFIKITDPAVVGVTGRPENTVRVERMLDLTPDGGLDFGKGMNVNLGRDREAVNLNVKGQPFNFDMFAGRPCKVMVKHEEYDGRLLAKGTAIAALG